MKNEPSESILLFSIFEGNQKNSHAIIQFGLCEYRVPAAKKALIRATTKAHLYPSNVSFAGSCRRKKIHQVLGKNDRLLKVQLSK